MKGIPSKLLLGGALLFVGSTAATADPIGPDCQTCQGSIYELTYSAANGGYDINLQIDTSDYTGSDTNYIDTVGFKISGMIDDLGTLGAAPGGSANWDYQFGPVNANGCQDASGSGWGCAQTALSDAQTDGSTYLWTFNDVEISPALQTGELEASIGARYVDATGAFVGPLVSEMITLQPENGNGPTPVSEPGALGLMGIGMLGMAWVRRRKQQDRGS